MKITIYKTEENYIYQNIAYIKAVFIKKYIENLKVTDDEKQNIFKETLKFLKNT